MHHAKSSKGGVMEPTIGMKERKPRKGVRDKENRQRGEVHLLKGVKYWFTS